MYHTIHYGTGTKKERAGINFTGTKVYKSRVTCESGYAFTGETTKNASVPWWVIGSNNVKYVSSGMILFGNQVWNYTQYPSTYVNAGTKKGTKINGYKTSYNKNAYPSNGVSGSTWYVYAGIG